MYKELGYDQLFRHLVWSEPFTVRPVEFIRKMLDELSIVLKWYTCFDLAFRLIL